MKFSPLRTHAIDRKLLLLLCPYLICATFAPIFTLYAQKPTETSVASLHGKFVDAENGQPIPGLLVSVASEKRDRLYPDRDFAHETETDADGTFSLTTPNDAQHYYAFSLMALHPRYQAKLMSVDIDNVDVGLRKDTTSRHITYPNALRLTENRYDLGEIAMKQVLTLHGKVAVSAQDRNLLPIPTSQKVDIDNVDVGLRKRTSSNVSPIRTPREQQKIVRLKMHAKSADFFRAAAQTELTTETDSGGNFVFTELYPIEYTLTISENNVIIAYIESVHPQNTAQLSVPLPKLETLHGTVFDAQGRTVPDAQIYAMRHRETPHGHGALLASAQADANGEFRMSVLETEPSQLSVEVARAGYFTTVYENVDIGEEPLHVTLEKGVAITGRVILPKKVEIDNVDFGLRRETSDDNNVSSNALRLTENGYYAVKIFPADAPLQAAMHPMALQKPLLTKRFPVTELAFTIDGLFEEKYTVYVVGDGIAAASVEVDASAQTKNVLIVADAPTKTVQGYIYWADTGEPVRNALVTRSWYPWELEPYDMSLTLERFESETDAHGHFQFENVTEGRYQLRIRAVNTARDETTGSYQRTRIQKTVDIPACGNAYHIYLGRRDGFLSGAMRSDR